MTTAPFEVEVVHQAGDWRHVDVERLVAPLLPHIAMHMPRGSHAVVALGDDMAVAALNRQFRGKLQATNVLSFPARGDYKPDASAGMGNMILALETCMAEAEADNTLLHHHITHLVLHGLLHLAGFDHDNADDARRMEDLERDILAELGIADPYASHEMEQV